MNANIRKHWKFYRLEYKEWQSNNVIIENDINKLLDQVKWKVLRLTINY